MDRLTEEQKALLDNMRNHIYSNNDGAYDEITANTLTSLRNLKEYEGTTGDNDIDDILDSMDDDELSEYILSEQVDNKDDVDNNDEEMLSSDIEEESIDDEEEKEEEVKDNVYTPDVEEFKQGGKTKKKTLVDISFIFDKALK
jgi:hypothetical protein